MSRSSIAIASEDGDAYSVIAADAGPVAAEYTLYFQNNSATQNFLITDIWSYATDADVVWKLASVTGTSAGTAITPVSLNVSTAKAAPATCRGGAAGVTGLTPVNTLLQWHNDIANTTQHSTVDGAIILGNGNAVAIEYDAGTGGAVILTMWGYYENI
jgi:hypothetical protein